VVKLSLGRNKQNISTIGLDWHNAFQCIICFTVSNIGLSGLFFIELIQMKPLSFSPVSKYVFRSEMVPPAADIANQAANSVSVPGMQNLKLDLQIGYSA
jgi:hypothetical protein